MWLRELRERLLRAGVAPRHVRRYLTELHEHWADLAAEEQRAGHNRAEAETLALARLGTVEDLARTMIERRELRSWTARAPWFVLGAGPAVGVLAAWAVAFVILATGWNWFLQGSPTPFVPLHGFPIFYFGVGRTLWFTAPILAGWTMILLAGRQRMLAIRPVILGALIVSLLGSTANVNVRPPVVPGVSGDVGIRFFPLPSQLAQSAGHALLLFLLIALPFLAWRWRTLQSDFGRQ